MDYIWHQTKTVAIYAFAIGCFIVGTIALFLPVIQGLMIIALGLFVLSKRSRIAKRWYDKCRAYIDENVIDRFRKSKKEKTARVDTNGS